jgi:predicted peptidase
VKIVKLLVVALLISSPAFAETGFLDRSITFKGETYPYQVYVPADYTSAKFWPVIVCLHGNGRQGNDGLRQTMSGLADSIRQNRSLFPAIAIFPQAKAGTRWLFPEMEELVIAELDRTIAEFHGDPRRIYLTGFSMGAAGAYRIAYRWPDKFAAVVAIAGRVEPRSTLAPEELAIDRRANPFVAEPDPFASLALRIKDIPMWIFHGDKDETVPVEQSRRLVAALKKAGADVRYTEYPGADHVGGAQKAFAETDMVKWLFKQHR